jgi:hypothetical protein
MFEKVLQSIEASIFTPADLKDLLTGRYVETGEFAGPAVIQQNGIFALAKPWLEQIMSGQNGRQMILEILGTPHPYRGPAPLHEKTIVPQAIELLKRFDPPPTAEEMRPLLLAEQDVPDPSGGVDITIVPLYNEALFLFAIPVLQVLIEKGDEEAISHTRRAIRLSSPKAFPAAKPLIALLAQKSKLETIDIDKMFQKNSGQSELENFKWIMSQAKGLNIKDLLCKLYGKTTPLHTPGALAVAKPFLDSLKLTLREKLHLLFETGPGASNILEGDEGSDTFQFNPAHVTIFEKNLETAKAWMGEWKNSGNDLSNIKSCVQAWAKDNRERQALIQGWV